MAVRIVRPKYSVPTIKFPVGLEPSACKMRSQSEVYVGSKHGARKHIVTYNQNFVSRIPIAIKRVY